VQLYKVAFQAMTCYDDIKVAQLTH